jgi:predicted enzyme related to lactoylglutathione lyase
VLLLVNKQANQIDLIELPATSAQALAKAKAFYADTFGWSFNDYGDDYADTQSSGVTVGFNADSSHRPAKPLAVIYAADLAATRAKVLAAGGTITMETFSFPGGKRFHFTDPCGNELAAWSDR